MFAYFKYNIFLFPQAYLYKAVIISHMEKAMSRGDVVLFQMKNFSRLTITMALVTRNSYDPMFNLTSL